MLLGVKVRLRSTARLLVLSPQLPGPVILSPSNSQVINMALETTKKYLSMQAKKMMVPTIKWKCERTLMVQERKLLLSETCAMVLPIRLKYLKQI